MTEFLTNKQCCTEFGGEIITEADSILETEWYFRKLKPFGLTCTIKEKSHSEIFRVILIWVEYKFFHIE